jgi:glycine hydroxymethyltransferase
MSQASAFDFADVQHSGFFTGRLREADGAVAEAIAAELDRQQNQIELIASENIVSRAVL